jgi:hypothetical protein
LCEYVGFVWEDDFWDRTGILVMAGDAPEAVTLVRDAFGDAVRMSLWNEEDAAKSR